MSWRNVARYTLMATDRFDEIARSLSVAPSRSAGSGSAWLLQTALPAKVPTNA